MFLVWVRTVLSETTSSAAISGPVSSLRRSRRTSSSRLLSSSTRPCCAFGGGRGRRRRRGGPRPVRRGPAVSHGGLEQAGHRRVRHRGRSGRSVRPRPGSVRPRSPRAPSACRRWLRGRAARSSCASMALPSRPPASAAASEALEQRDGVGGSTGGEEDAGEGEVLVLAEVGGFVVGGETGRGRPPLGAAEVARGEPYPGGGGGDGPGLGRVVGVVALLGFAEQLEGAGVVAVGSAGGGRRRRATGTACWGRARRSPSSRLARRCSAAASSSLRSRWSSASPTCMSAVPRSGPWVAARSSPAARVRSAARSGPGRPACRRGRGSTRGCRRRYSASSKLGDGGGVLRGGGFEVAVGPAGEPDEGGGRAAARGGRRVR